MDRLVNLGDLAALASNRDNLFMLIGLKAGLTKSLEISKTEIKDYMIRIDAEMERVSLNFLSERARELLSEEAANLN